ncbi:hypothetical protein AAP_03900 [Ascosphaera apis ARSEF 7405]|uniref:Uncharacterized protein n=1 Tax=Ascosphaera apis ARSEF 7405 TaxID=392613 RepID=A0A166NJ55_9EURO|nr:hypothetical protein AAP_03900 [Ascosphaera apis ARSEF 7405]
MQPLILILASIIPALALPQAGGGAGGFVTLPTPTASSGPGNPAAAASTTPALSIPGIKRDERQNLEEIAKILQALSILPNNINLRRSPQTALAPPELSGAIILKERQALPTQAPEGNAALPSGLTAGEASSILAYLSSAHII